MMMYTNVPTTPSIQKESNDNDSMDFVTAIKTVECTLELYIRGSLNRHDEADKIMAENIRSAISIVKRGY